MTILRNLTLAGLALAATTGAHADFIPELRGGAPVGNVYTYDIRLTGDTTAVSGSFFTFYDFAGLVPGATTFSGNPNFTFSTQNTGITPAFQAPPDNPTLPNVTFTYNGPNVAGPSDPFVTVMLTSSNPFSGVFTPFSGATRNTANGSPANNTTFVLGPNANVPEPGSIALLIGGTVSGAVVLRRRKR